MRLISACTLGMVIGTTAAPALAQRLPPAERAERVAFTRPPVLESAHDDVAIIRWDVTNPGGLDVHYGVVHYGTDSNALGATALSPIRLNRDHGEATFRVRLSGLLPGTTYFYTVTSIDSDGRGDGVESGVAHFTTPRPRARFHEPEQGREAAP